MSQHLLAVERVTKHFPVGGGVLGRPTGTLQAVTDLTFSVGEGETFGLVGESGCGKSTVANLILLLHRVTSGDIRFSGRSILGLSRSELKGYRQAVQAVFQDPYGALNPRMRVRDILSEPMEIAGYVAPERQQRIAHALELVGLPVEGAGRFPHEFSGGQRQRIVLARALTVRPRLIVLDEPISNLDVSLRSQMMNLLKEVQARTGVSYLFISHDLAAVGYMSQRVGVMYLGRLVEVGSATQVLQRPLHPYTAALLTAATPRRMQPPWPVQITGQVASPLDIPRGCAFHPRCPFAMPVCTERRPELALHDAETWVACHLHEAGSLATGASGWPPPQAEAQETEKRRVAASECPAEG